MDTSAITAWIDATIDSAIEQISALNAQAEAARPDPGMKSWPERDAADAIIAPINRALANLRDALP